MNGIIDVGSNSVRLAVFDGDKEIYSDLSTTRLGTGLVKTENMRDEDIANTVFAISRFVKECEKRGASVDVFGTAACRQAKNAAVFLDKVKREVGVNVEVLSGDEEARIAFVGGSVVAKSFPCAVLDIGGASSEIALGTEKNILLSKSYPVGAVKAYSKCGEDKEANFSYINSVLAPLLPLNAKSFVAIGGTATSIASILSGEKEYRKSVTHGFSIKTSELKVLTDKLFEVGLSGRREISSIDEKRAEIIASGAAILTVLAEKLGAEEIIASESDNLYGYLKVFVK